MEMSRQRGLDMRLLLTHLVPVHQIFRRLVLNSEFPTRLRCAIHWGVSIQKGGTKRDKRRDGLIVFKTQASSYSNAVLDIKGEKKDDEARRGPGELALSDIHGVVDECGGVSFTSLPGCFSRTALSLPRHICVALFSSNVGLLSIFIATDDVVE